MRIRTRLGHALAIASLVGGGGLATSASAVETVAEPPAVGVRTCTTITFDRARVVTDTWTGRRVLVVSGQAPYAGTEVSLVPLVYIQQPEYWGIEVIGCLPEIGLPVMTPYTVKLDLTGTVGTVGIEVIGSDRSLKIPLRPVKALG